MNDLQPGERVVDLGAMVCSVMVAAGALSSALLLFLAKQSGGRCFAGFLLGAISGFLLGLLLARIFYADGQGKVRVVKAAPENLPVTLNAAVKGALCQTVVVLAGVGGSGEIASWPLAILTALGANLLVAFVMARLSLS